MNTNSATKNQKGLTLIETIVVTGIVGIVSAGIWMASSSVQSKNNINETAQNVNEIGMLVRNAYVGLSSAAAPTLAQQINKGLFPPQILNAAGTATQNFWGGIYALDFVTTGGRLRGAAVRLTLPAGLPQTQSKQICAGIMSQIVLTGTNAGTFVALSAAPPTANPMQGSGPTNVFLNGTDRTGLTPPAAVAALGAANCQSIAFYFPF